jgi:hypothetical protein
VIEVAVRELNVKIGGKEMVNLLLVIGVILVVLWVLGLITSYTLGGGIHVLLVIAIIAIIVWFVMGRGYGHR